MKPYARQYNPASNAHGIDTSPRHNLAPKGVRITGKQRLRRSEKKSTRQQAKSAISREACAQA